MQALEPSDLETLERLCEKGEMLLSSANVFYPLLSIIRAGFAEQVGAWIPEVPNGKPIISVVKPTELGRQISAIRVALKARLRKPRLKFGNTAGA